MSTSKSPLVAFLLARLHEDERAARAAATVDGEVAVTMPPATVEHVARHDPARVLRDVAALRAIVHDPATTPAVLLRLAAVHEGHPAFHPAWATPDPLPATDDVVVPLHSRPPTDGG